MWGVNAFPYSALGLAFLLCLMLKYADPTSAFYPDSDLGPEDERFRKGKEKYEAIRAEAKIPRYSKCWTDALRALEIGCKTLTDETQHRLALSFANCFLHRSGREIYPCESTQDIGECTGTMKAEAYNTYTEFFTHTQNICFFLQAQIWQEQTQKTVHRLSESSEFVAQQIEDSGHIQKEIMKKQNDSLTNQEQLLRKGNELKTTLEDSTVDVQKMLKEFKMATEEQKMSIMEVFDKIQSLQSLVLGEFTGFYSMIFYTTSLIVSYLITSTPRTNGARVWLFLVMTLNVVCERLLVTYGANDFIDDQGQQIDSAAIIYRRLQLCRKCFCVLGVVILVLKALFYLDINKANNELLQTITEQNHQIKHLLQSSSTSSLHGLLGAGDPADGSMLRMPEKYGDEIDSPIEGYETGSESDSDESVDSAATDHTYKPKDYDNISNCSAFSHMSKASTWDAGGLLEELGDIRETTPVNTLMLDNSDILSGATTSTPRRRGRPPGSKNKTREAVQSLPRYQLRNRSATPLRDTSLTPQESPEDFGRMVKHLAEVSKRNSHKTKHTLSKLRHTERDRMFSDDD